MREIMLEQGSSDWLEYRRSRIGGSDAATVLGISPWCTPQKLYEQKINGTESFQSAAMLRGKIYEQEAREYFEKELGLFFRPVVVQHPDIPWMMASLDGISADNETIIEIKTPYSEESIQLAKKGVIPDYYNVQMVHTKHCVPEAKRILYCTYYPDEKCGDIRIVDDQEALLKTILDEEQKFAECLRKKTPPVSKRIIINDLEFLSLTDEYKAIDMDMKMLEARKAEIRERIISIADGNPIAGNGITLSQSVSKGTIVYKDMPQELLDQIEPYRKEGKETWTVRIV